MLTTKEIAVQRVAKVVFVIYVIAFFVLLPTSFFFGWQRDPYRPASPPVLWILLALVPSLIGAYLATKRRYVRLGLAILFFCASARFVFLIWSNASAASLTTYTVFSVFLKSYWDVLLILIFLMISRRPTVPS